jgi:hypothetical protein
MCYQKIVARVDIDGGLQVQKFRGDEKSCQVIKEVCVSARAPRLEAVMMKGKWGGVLE